MSELSEFVLGLYQSEGAIVEPPAYGVCEVLLPEALAAQLNVPAWQEIVFDETEPEASDGKLYLTRGHPLVDRLVERARRAPAPAQAYINAVRLDKKGLAELGRQALSLPNGRLVEVKGQMEAAALCHYLRFTFKVTLSTDEKREYLTTVSLDAQGGWRVDWQAIQERATLEAMPAFDHLAPAPPCWIEEANPLAPAALAGLLERAQRGVLEEMAKPIEVVRRRAARHLELDRARLEQYYDDMARDVERRLGRADASRRATLQDKLASVQAERELKLADAEARYRLRIDLELVTVQVIRQPKLVLPVQIENRHTAVQRRIVWDPLLHRIEPLLCDVCGRPGLALHLCSGGHLAHADCLLAEQCVDCKRVHCRLCQAQMSACVVCGRPVCANSLNRCSDCGRGTCHEHSGLCHASGGQPVAITAAAGEQAPPAPAPKRGKAAMSAPAQSTGVPAHSAPPAARGQQPTKGLGRPAAASRSGDQRAPAARPVATRIEVQSQWSEPVVTAFVLAGKKRGPAARTWRLTPQGIAVCCSCEKGGACEADQRLIRPEPAAGIQAQMKDLIEALRQEYGVPARSVTYFASVHGIMSQDPQLILRGRWKDEAALSQARARWQAEYDRQHPRPEPPARSRGSTGLRPLEAAEKAEAERLLQAALGLLRFEGVLKLDELYERLVELVLPGDWCTPQYLAALLEANGWQFKVQASGLVALSTVNNVQAMARRKTQLRLLPRSYNLEELLAAGESNLPLSEREARIEAQVEQLAGEHWSARQLQDLARNAGSVGEFCTEVLLSCPDLAEGDEGRLLALLEELWHHTTRYELRGRAPAEMEHHETARGVMLP